MLKEKVEAIVRNRSREVIRYGWIAALFLCAFVPVYASSDNNIERGKVLAMERSKGNCLACHKIADGELPGNLGPPLLMMKVRFPERSTLREQICDASVRNPDSRMPPFGKHGILSEEEVDLILDYVYSL